MLSDLEPDDIEPLFELLDRSDATDLGKPVLDYVMGNQFGKYAKDDVVDVFVVNPSEAANVLSLFFDDSLNAVTRLRAFREHTIYVTNRENRAPASLDGLATSLLMFAFPDRQIGLPWSRTKTFMEANSTLAENRSGFRPIQYGAIIPALRALRDEVQGAFDEHGISDDNDLRKIDQRSSFPACRLKDLKNRTSTVENKSTGEWVEVDSDKIGRRRPQFLWMTRSWADIFRFESMKNFGGFDE